MTHISAIEALRSFMAAMRDWEVKYYELYRASLINGDEVGSLGVEMLRAKRKIIDQWCSIEVQKHLSSSPSAADPPAFDPDRDELNIEKISENEFSVTHTQKAGLKSSHRFSLALKADNWIIDNLEILEKYPLIKWVPMII